MTKESSHNKGKNENDGHIISSQGEDYPQAAPTSKIVIRHKGSQGEPATNGHYSRISPDSGKIRSKDSITGKPLPPLKHTGGNKKEGNKSKSTKKK